MSDAEKASLRAFLANKRGSRHLIESTRDALFTYFSAKGVSLRELPTDTPVVKEDVEDPGFRSGLVP